MASSPREVLWLALGWFVLGLVFGFIAGVNFVLHYYVTIPRA